MRVLLSSYYYPPSVGGVERQSHLLARTLAQRGHRVTVLAARLPGFSSAEWLDGVQVRRISPGGGGRWRSMGGYLARLLLATATLAPRVDVIHVQQALYPAAALAALAPLVRRPLVVRNSGSGRFGAVQLMGQLPLGGLGLWLMARNVVGVSLSAEMTREMRGVGFRRIEEIPNAVEIPPIEALNARAASRHALGIGEAAGPLAVYVGRLDEEKGVDVLLEAWRLVDVQAASLVVVGDGPRREALTAQAARGSWPTSRPVLLPARPDIATLYGAADVVVLPSRSEGLSNTLLEALAHGRPVVGTDVGGTRDLLQASGGGVVVPPERPADLAAMLAALLADPSRAAALGTQGREYVAAHHGVDAMVDRYERLYASLLAPASRRRS